jgi:hypothetical protein
MRQRFCSPLHHALRDHLDPVLSIDHYRGRFHGRQCADRAADKIGQSWRIDEVDAGFAAVQVHEGGIERVLIILFKRIVVADRRTFFDAAHRTDGAGAMQQCLGERRLACSTMTDQRYGANHFRGEFRHGSSALLRPPWTRFRCEHVSNVEGSV